ncbi:MAG: 6-bladed beta-propeller, partial [Blastocatellia bacterium]
DAQNDRIQKLDTNLAFLSKFGSIGSGDGQFQFPLGIALNSAGEIYVVDSGNSRVEVFRSSGAFLRKFGSEGLSAGQFYDPTGIAVDSSGNLYVVDTGNNRIQKFSPTGEFLAVIGGAGSGDGQFTSPVGIVIDHAGNIWVADSRNSRIQKFDPRGDFLAAFGRWGFQDGQLLEPNGIAVDVAGNVYVADFFAPDPTPGASIARPASTSDPTLGRIQKFGADGAFIGEIAVSGSDDGQVDFAEGLASDSSGNIYVAIPGITGCRSSTLRERLLQKQGWTILPGMAG